MHTFAAKQKPSQETKPASFATPGRAFSRQGREVSLIPLSQRSIGNHTAEQPLQAHEQELKDELRTGVLPRFDHNFSRIPVHADAPTTIQPKLQGNILGDTHEQEADRIAERVMRMPDPQLHRNCSCGGGCSGCQNDQAAHESLQTKRVQANDTEEIAAPHIINEVLSSSGQPLDASTRAFMEPRFGHDFSHVRVHTDARAVESANALRAQAYTAGHHIAFSLGQYRPDLREGRQLLAHELTYTLQQRASTKLDDGSGSQVSNTERNSQSIVKRNESYSGLHVGPPLFLPVLQRQVKLDDDPAVKTEKPTSRALMLLEMFTKRKMNTKLSFEEIDCSIFDREYDDKDAKRETIQGKKGGIPWTFTFVTNEKTYFLPERKEVNSIFVRESQDGTQIVNCYQRVLVFGTEGDANWLIETNNSLFKKGTGQFDFSSPEFSKFMERLNQALLDNHDVSHTPLIITIEGQKDSINLQGANTIKDNLIKRGAKAMNISIEFGEKAESPLIFVKTNY